MADYSCTFTDAVVRPDRRDDLEALIRKMFARRHHNRVSAGPSGQMWLTVELVQALRRASQVYRDLSTKTTGPLPFEIGFLRVVDGDDGGRLEPISDPLPMSSPEVFVRLVSEFVHPGATVTLNLVSDRGSENGSSKKGAGKKEKAPPAGGTWTLHGTGEVEKHGP